jgi:hypothetical protein
MLAAMSMPLEVSADLEFRADGTAILTQRFSRENQAVTEASVVQTWYSGADEGLSGFPAWIAADFFPAVRTAVWQQHAFANRHNSQLDEWNLRIAQTLNRVTDQQLPGDPKAWWSWWDEYNEVRASKKPVVHRYRWQMRLTHSCFAAGTPVWTIDGPRPIERLALGDLVLAQNVDTGELAYKPVLRTTIGSPIELVTLKAGEDTIQCTGGHAFWVPGSGWAHARKLAGQTRVHGVSGAIRVDAVEPGPKRKTYNLVVADWNTYFIGRGKLLVHDISLPRPTSTDVPGLKSP